MDGMGDGNCWEAIQSQRGYPNIGKIKAPAICRLKDKGARGMMVARGHGLLYEAWS